jgi:hypothetical protein
MSDVERTVIAQANVTLDGMTSGPGGDLSWLNGARRPPADGRVTRRDLARCQHGGHRPHELRGLPRLLAARRRRPAGLTARSLPSVVGGGLRLLDDGLPPSAWQLVGAITLQSGGVCMHHRRLR